MYNIWIRRKESFFSIEALYWRTRPLRLFPSNKGVPSYSNHQSLLGIVGIEYDSLYCHTGLFVNKKKPRVFEYGPLPKHRWWQRTSKLIASRSCGQPKALPDANQVNMFRSSAQHWFQVNGFMLLLFSLFFWGADSKFKSTRLPSCLSTYIFSSYSLSASVVCLYTIEHSPSSLEDGTIQICSI